MIRFLADMALLALLPFNWLWLHNTRKLWRAVPGSLEQEFYKVRCRRIRYAGVILWPGYAIRNFVQASIFLVTDGKPFEAGFFLLVAAINIWLASIDIKEFRRQMEEDDDDLWKKSKRAAKKAVKRLAAARMPQLAPSPA